MEQPEYRFFVGVDWATEAHQVCVLDEKRKVVAERSVEHSGPGINQFLDWLTKLAEGDPGRVAVAIEIPRGAVVESLIERAFHVYAINPKQLDRFRDRHTVAGAKDDRRDAFVLGDSLGTDRHCFRRLRVDDPLVVQIRELSRIDEDLRQETNRLANRLREQLHRFFPQVLRLCPAADEPWLWALLDLAPSPEKVARLTPRRIEKLLSEHRIRRVTADQVLAELKTEPLTVAPGTVEAATAHIRLLLPRLSLAREQRSDCARAIEAMLDQLSEGQRREHRDVQVLRSLPGIGKVVAATMLAEASQPLAERDYHALRALAGAAPITRQSGKRRTVIMRHGCNGRLRNALYHWARVSSQVDPSSRDLYASSRARGHTHGRALRGLADRLLRILVAMLKAGTLYDPSRARRVPTGSPAQVPA